MKGKNCIKGRKVEIDAISEPGNYYLPTPPGFHIHVTKCGTKIFRLRVKGRASRRNFTEVLGRYGVWTLAQAQAWANESYIKIKAGHVGDKRRAKEPLESQGTSPWERDRDLLQELTVRRVASEYISSRSLSPKTVENYECSLRMIADWLSKPISSITPLMCQAKVAEISNASPANGRNLNALMNAVFNFARHRYTLTDGSPALRGNPWESVRKNSILKDVPPRETPIEPERLHVWYRSVMDLDEPLADLFMFMLLTGCRVTAACRLRWVDIDFSKGVIQIQDTKQQKERKRHYQLPMTTQLRDLLQRRRPSNGGDFRYVFPGLLKGDFAAQIPISKAAKATEHRAGKWTSHDLRKTFATEAATICTESELKALIHHSRSSDVTHTHYVNLSPQALLPALQRLNDKLMGLCCGSFEDACLEQGVLPLLAIKANSCHDSPKTAAIT